MIGADFRLRSGWPPLGSHGQMVHTRDTGRPDVLPRFSLSSNDAMGLYNQPAGSSPLPALARPQRNHTSRPLALPQTSSPPSSLAAGHQSRGPELCRWLEVAEARRAGGCVDARLMCVKGLLDRFTVKGPAPPPPYNIANAHRLKLDVPSSACAEFLAVLQWPSGRNSHNTSGGGFKHDWSTADVMNCRHYFHLRRRGHNACLPLVISPKRWAFGTGTPQ